MSHHNQTGGERIGHRPHRPRMIATGQDRAPEDAGKPESPTKLTKPSWKYIARKTLREFSDDQCTDLAAALTYYSVLALFPALLAMVSLLGLFGQAGKTDQLIERALRHGRRVRRRHHQRTAASNSPRTPPPGLALVIGVVGALWSASGYVGAFGRAMNRIYEIQEGRPFWKLRPLMIVITLAAVILAGLVAIGLVVSGPVARAIGEAIGLGDTAVTIWGIVKWPVLLGLAAVVVAILYYATPNVQQPKFRWISLGAVVAIITWVDRVRAVRPLRLAVLELQQDLRLPRRGDHLPALVVDHQPGVAVRRRTERRNGTRSTTPGRDPRRGRTPITAPRHPGHRQERRQGRPRHRTGQATPEQPRGQLRTHRFLTPTAPCPVR